MRNRTCRRRFQTIQADGWTLLMESVQRVPQRPDATGGSRFGQWRCSPAAESVEPNGIAEVSWEAAMWNSLTDDQIVQLACLGALVFAVGLTSLSYWLGSARKDAMTRMTSSDKLTAHLMQAKAARRKAA
jgi:hypothetical protein